MTIKKFASKRTSYVAVLSIFYLLSLFPSMLCAAVQNLTYGSIIQLTNKTFSQILRGLTQEYVPSSSQWGVCGYPTEFGDDTQWIIASNTKTIGTQVVHGDAIILQQRHYGYFLGSATTPTITLVATSGAEYIYPASGGQAVCCSYNSNAWKIGFANPSNDASGGIYFYMDIWPKRRLVCANNFYPLAGYSRQELSINIPTAKNNHLWSLKILWPATVLDSMPPATGSRLQPAAAPAPVPPPVPPAPTPVAMPVPAPTVAPVPAPEPTPAPVVSPAPAPEPVVIPEPAPAPAVSPEPAPAPGIEPAPTPAEPTPAPAPDIVIIYEPAPTPSPEGTVGEPVPVPPVPSPTPDMTPPPPPAPTPVVLYPVVPQPTPTVTPSPTVITPAPTPYAVPPTPIQTPTPIYVPPAPTPVYTPTPAVITPPTPSPVIIPTPAVTPAPVVVVPVPVPVPAPKPVTPVPVPAPTVTPTPVPKPVTPGPVPVPAPAKKPKKDVKDIKKPKKAAKPTLAKGQLPVGVTRDR